METRMTKRIAAGALSVLLAGCGYSSADYTVGDSFRLSVERDGSGAVSLVEVAFVPVTPSPVTCGRMKLDVAVKNGAPTAVLARHRAPC
jgi:hypothetical protein